MSLYTSHQRGSGLLSDLFEFFVGLYVRPRVIGAEHLPTAGAYLLAANHNSHADTAVIFSAVPRRLRHRLLAAAAQDYFFVGGLRQRAARTLFNAIPVERETTRRDPLRHVVRALREGYGVLIYPEGTRSRNGRIGSFRSGIGRLIAQFPNVPVIPTLVEGTDQVMPKGRSVPVPRSVKVTFGAPLFLQAELGKKPTWQAAANQVREVLVEMRPAQEADRGDSPPA
jgi:1-acyl-sn-glycerol-3-phosphate acyltransferase